jgi:membrane fusion protein (multidrug efflux system)
MENNNGKPSNGKKNGIKRYIPLMIVIVVVLTIGFFWYREFLKYISTDDAHVDSDNVSISSKILGRIVHLYADEGDSVKKGMLLAELDSSDLLSDKKQTIAAKDQALASQVQAEAKYQYDQENIKVLEVNFEKAQDDYKRSKDQFAGEVIPKEQFDHDQKNFESAKAQLEAAKTQLMVSKAQIGIAMAAIENAKAQIGVITTKLSNTRLYAPFDGIIARRWLLPGDITQPGQSIFTLNNNNKLWIAVYLEETKVENVHVNQKAKFTIDAFPGVTFVGKVFSIGSNTAAQFSLIPPNNASGNFTKITQRVPLKISIEGTENNKNIADYKILAGMSAVIKIIKGE